MIKLIASISNQNLIKTASLTGSLFQINRFFLSNQPKQSNKAPSAILLQTNQKANKHIFSSNNSNTPLRTKASSSYETINNEGKRVEWEIFSTQHEPSFIRQYIEDSKPAKLVKEFNPYLTNGGQQFQEFPLIKLISIALKKIEENNIEPASWRNLQFYIKKRLHRCTIEENLKLLYIMLRSFPKYTFDYGFIMSICLALKKQMNLMSSEHLKSMFYVLYTNRNEVKRYNNPILANLQSLVLTKVLEKCQNKLLLQQKIKGTHLPVQYLYSWIMFAFTLSLRNNYYQLIFEERAIQLIKHFNQRWKVVVSKEQQNKITNQAQIANILYFACIYDSLIRYSANQTKTNSKVQKNISKNSFRQDFELFKLNIIAHASNKINKIMKTSSPLQRMRTFRSLLELYSFELVQNLLSTDADIEQSSQSLKYPHIVHTFSKLMQCSDITQEILTQKLKILNKLFNNNLITFDSFKTYYQSISINFPQFPSSLDIINQLIFAELIIFTNENAFNPHQTVVQFILIFLQNNAHTYRNFDWHSFHFVSQLIQKTNNSSLSISSNLPTQFSQHKNDVKQERLIKILTKIGEQVKFYNTQKLINQETEVLKEKTSLKNIQKFFIEIRVNEMERLKPVLNPFNRLPHFSNAKEKIAVNSLTEDELKMAEYQIQKKLLNISGWKVINLNSANFIELSLNERLKFIANNLQKQAELLEAFRKVQAPLLERI